MLDWENPVRLVALSGISLIWWLHRRALVGATFPVSAAFLWVSAMPQIEVKKQRARPDRIWLLRAALFSSVVIALANPFFDSTQRAPIGPLAASTVDDDNDDIALTNLSLRRANNVSDAWDGNVTISSLAHKSVAAILTIQLNNRVIASTTLNLAPMNSTLYAFTIPNSTIGETLTAQIISTDTGTENKQLQLETAALLPVATRVIGDCSNYLHAALRSMPGLVMATPSNNPGFAIVCGNAAFPANRPTLILHNTDQETALIASSGRWRKGEMSPATLELGSLWLPKALPKSLPGTPVLTSGERTLASIEETTPRRVHVWFDVQNKSLALTPQFPILVNQLVSLTLEQDQSDSVAYVSRAHEATASKASRHAASAPHRQNTQRQTLDLTPWFIALALLLLTLDGLWHTRWNQQRV